MELIQGTCRLGGMAALYAGATDQGRVRTINEDAFLLSPEAGLFAVADGLGGLDAGDVASSTALTHLRHLGSTALNPLALEETPQSRLEAMIAAVNRHTYDHRLALGNTMATTLAMVWFAHGAALAAHVGDSRIYRWHGGSLTRMTNDHSLVYSLLEQGALTEAQARLSPQRHVITRAVGAEAVVEPSIRQVEVTPGDILLLCTDGLTSMVTDEEIAASLKSDSADIGRLVERLVHLANKAGGRDNITVVGVAIQA